MFDSTVAPGTYVVAVSGGVDSVVLLDILVKLHHLKLVVAHVDHGMRENSDKDRKFVENLAKNYQLPFYYINARLGRSASEELARKVRYDFLNKIKEQANAKAIITAHHQDDLLETITLNILRGTKRKGVTALKSKEGILRPLLNMSKQQLYEYAKKHNLKWREDSTNLDTKYSRNWIRHKVIPKLSDQQRAQILGEHQILSHLNTEIDEIINQEFFADKEIKQLARSKFISLPHNVATEVIAAWLRKHKYGDFDRSSIEKITVNMKRLSPGKTISIYGASIDIAKDSFIFNSSQK